MVLPWFSDDNDQAKEGDILTSQIDSGIKPATPEKVVPASNSVHDRVIDTMLAQHMCVSKDQIEFALKNSREVSSGSRLLAANLAANATSITAPDIIAVNGEVVPSPVNDNYIVATYNLLKDKLVREIQGISPNNSNVHEIRSNLYKRGSALRPRKPLVQQAPRFMPRFNPPMSSVSKDDKPNGSEVNTGTVVNHIENLAEEEPFALPLQRKCSIVSEEGSCAGADLSGHNSEGGSDVHTFLVGEDDSTVTVRRSHPSVNIVVTDYSSDTFQNDIPLEEMELNEVSSDCLMDEETPEKSDEEESPETRTMATDQKLANLVCSASDRLHQVSSSPDFQRERNGDYADENEGGNTSGCQKGTDMPKGPVMLIDSKNEENQVNDIERHVPRRNSRQTTDAIVSPSSKKTSTTMRVIMSSKSCNDILMKENNDGTNGSNAGSCRDSTNRKSTGCGQLIKRNKGDRTDCCTIC